MNKYNLLNKITLFVCQDYIKKSRDDNGTVPPVLSRLDGSITGYKAFHMFSVLEAKEVLRIASKDEIKTIMEKEVSFIVFVMEVMKIWTQTVPKKDRPHLNISDKQFKLGGRIYWQQMMALKKVDVDKYDHKTDVIDDSIKVAREFMNFHLRETV